MNQQRYYRLSKSFTDNRMLPMEVNPYTSGDVNPEQDWYTSLYMYDQSHYETWKKNHSFSGLDGVKANQLFFDFDNKGDLESARKDALEVISRIAAYNVPTQDIQICFSGSKGFSVKIKTEQEFTPEELKNITSKLADGLATYDPVVYDSQRIIRMVGTKHQDSKMYKTPLTLAELETLDVETIKGIASTVEEVNTRMAEASWNVVSLPDKIYSMRTAPKLREVKKKSTNVEIDAELEALNLSDKPRWLPGCKFALQEGFFGEGSRREAFMILAATYKAQGFHSDMVYRMLKGVAEKQATLHNVDRFPDEEVYRVAEEVSSPKWKGGQYTCKTHPILAKVCEKLGKHSCANKKEDDGEYKPQKLIEIKDSFKDYVKNIDKNTILTGLPTFDQNVFLSTGVNMGIIGSPGSGKTSIALNILNNTSKAGVHSVFASLDMHKNRMFEKVLYKVSGLPRGELYKMFKDNREMEVLDKVKEEFGNVNFFNKSAPTVKDVRDYIIRCQDESGEKIKLVMLDYFERISSDYSDDTQASKRVAGELQDLVNDLDIALITLVQPNKMGISGGPDTPIYNYTAIKGSSFVYQAFRVIVSMWRPFYTPKDFKDDRFMQMAVLKNDLGELNEFAFAWDGPRGEIRELEDHESYELEEKLKRKEESKPKGDW